MIDDPSVRTIRERVRAARNEIAQHSEHMLKKVSTLEWCADRIDALEQENRKLKCQLEETNEFADLGEWLSKVTPNEGQCCILRNKADEGLVCSDYYECIDIIEEDQENGAALRELAELPGVYAKPAGKNWVYTEDIDSPVEFYGTSPRALLAQIKHHNDKKDNSGHKVPEPYAELFDKLGAKVTYTPDRNAPWIIRMKNGYSSGPLFDPPHDGWAHWVNIAYKNQ